MRLPMAGSQQPIDLGPLAPGMYLAKLVTSDGGVHVQRLLRQ